MYRRYGKRLLDLAISIFAGLLLLPLCVVIAVLIKLSDGGPVFFSHDRVGKDGALFRFIKFRSMPVATRDVPSDQLGEIRLSWIGRVIRRTNADELPQLLNVLRGEMSVVGPRPPVPAQEELVALRRANGALGCRPGLTGLAQVNAYDGMTVEAKAEFDGKYAENVSFAGDLSIILRTFLYLLKPPPVY